MGQQQDDWMRRHVKATLVPTPAEALIVGPVHAVTMLSITKGDDFVAREGIVKMAEGLRSLLSAVDLGRLDPGTLDGLIIEAMERCNYDADTSQFREDRC